MIAANALASARLLAGGMRCFNEHRACGIEPRLERIAELLDRSLMLVTVLAPHIGHEKAAAIAHKAHHEGTTLCAAALAAGYATPEQYERWIDPLAMTRPSLACSPLQENGAPDTAVVARLRVDYPR